MKICILGAGTAGLIAALIIRERYPLYPITIIKSGEIGIVGVGEGSTEQWEKFINYTNISHIELFQHAGSTVKIGILFKDWNLEKDYVHSVERLPFTKFGTPDIYDRLLQINEEKFPLTPTFNNIFYRGYVPLKEDLKVSNQYHFDTFKLNEFLQNLCSKRDIDIIDDKIIDAEICEVTGNVLNLKSNSNTYTSDLFFDCSGFRRFLSSKVGNKWISKTEYLPMNHAIAFPTEFDQNYNPEPYTTCTALSSGWAWKIPTQERYGNGYVFSDNFLNTDQALKEISDHLGKNIEKAARDIKFEAGKVEKFWIKNVVCLGLSGSFLEPLEAQSIGFSIQQAFAFLDVIESLPFRDARQQYNKDMDSAFENALSFIQMHYLVQRDDSLFWKEKPFHLTEFNKEIIESFKHGIFGPRTIDDSPFSMFWISNWYQIVNGIGLLDKNYVLNKFKKNKYSKGYEEEFINIAREEIKFAKNRPIISHRDFINLAKLQYTNRHEN